MLLFASSFVSLILCASPPESVVALCPSLIYPSPTEERTESLFLIEGILSKTTSASSTLKLSISAIVFSWK